ncbi:MAG: glutathione S-transferase family protein [Polyangiales bacterium]
MLTLFQPPRAWATPSSSAFCTKVETYLRMADIPYKIEWSASTVRNAPRGKVPYIELDGQLISDSSRIIAHLKERLGDTVDVHLDAAQHALGHLIQRTLEEGTYWGLVYNRWGDDDNFERVRDALFGGFGVLRWVLPDLVRRKMLGTLHAQGTSRHEAPYIYERVAHDFSAIGLQLGDRPYLFGDRPSSYDAVLYAFAAAIWKTPFAAAFAPPPDNVRAHLERMHRRYFPELPAA